MSELPGIKNTTCAEDLILQEKKLTHVAKFVYVRSSKNDAVSDVSEEMG